MDPEPYVADPAEPVPPTAVARFRGVTAGLAVLLVVLALAYAVWTTQTAQDPAFEMPSPAATPAA